MTNAAATTDIHEETFQHVFKNSLADAKAAASERLAEFTASISRAGSASLFGSDIDRAINAIATLNVLEKLERSNTNQDLARTLDSGSRQATSQLGLNGGAQGLLEVAMVKAWSNAASRFTY